MKVKKSQICLIAAAVLGVVAFCMLFLSGVDTTVMKMTEGTSAFKLIFATEDGMKFNIIMFLSFVFLVVGLVGVVLSFVLKGKIGKLLAIVGFAVAGILFFLFNAVFSMSVEGGADAIKIVEAMGGKFSLGIGAIMAGILSLVAAVASAVATFAIKD